MASSSSSSVAKALRLRDLLALAETVCAHRGVALDDLCGRARTQSVSWARHEVWWRIRHHPERWYSLLEIARLFGRDHATIRHGIVAHERRLAACVCLSEVV
jgi:chromosomal replication initiation ATPase DnaA